MFSSLTCTKDSLQDDIALQKRVYKLQPQQLSKFMPIIFHPNLKKNKNKEGGGVLKLAGCIEQGPSSPVLLQHAVKENYKYVEILTVFVLVLG